jgi:hypothetical protein
MMKMKKQALNAEVGKGGPKYEQAAKGASLAKGVSHYEGKVEVDGLHARPEAESRQVMPKGSDRI